MHVLEFLVHSKQSTQNSKNTKKNAKEKNMISEVLLK